jgi:agmatinase
MVNVQPQFPSYFADAESTYSDAEFVIFGMPYDKTASFRFGAAKAPDAIRHASWNLESFNVLTNVDFKELLVHDYGNIDGLGSCPPKQMIQRVSSFSKKLMSDHKIPVGIGGEHSCSIGIVANIPKDCYVIIFDAHLDYRDTYENESYNHACTIRRMADHIDIDHIIVLGIRSAEKDEYLQAKKDGLRFFTIPQINKRGIETIIKDAMKQIGNHPVYLSLDIDVVDPGFAPGTGTPEPFGLHPMQLCSGFDLISSQLIGFDIMEVNPLFDHGQTTMLAARYLRYGIEIITANRH